MLRTSVFVLALIGGCESTPESPGADTDPVDSPSADTDTTSDTDIPGEDTDTPSGDTDVEPAPPVSLDGRVTEFSLLEDVPLEGATIEVMGDPSVTPVTSDAKGTFQLVGAPANSELLLSFSHPDFTGLLMTFRTGEADEELIPAMLLTDDDLALVASLSIVPPVVPEGDKGFLAFAARDGDESSAAGIADVTVSLDPASGDGPYYNNVIGLPASDTEATSSLYDALGGGVYGNVTPGDYVLTFSHADLTCSAGSLAWPQGPDATRLTIQAGYISLVSMICD